MQKKHKRLLIILSSLACFAIAIIIILREFERNILFFYSPKEVVELEIQDGKIFRLGGMVKEGSVNYDASNSRLEFIITDFEAELSVLYYGIKPNMFREKQGMVGKGRLAEGIFIADELLTKHDENYMPPEVADKLKKVDYDR